jgi:hypothetical protein
VDQNKLRDEYLKALADGLMAFIAGGGMTGKQDRTDGITRYSTAEILLFCRERANNLAAGMAHRVKDQDE